MIVCKYTKIGSAVFVPHLDVLRSVIMGIRRAKITIDYSSGFNPHMQLYFNQPLPIGVASECEYFCAHSNMSAEEFKERLNKQLPQGVQILKAGNVNADPNVAKIMDSALYRVTMRDVVSNLAEFTEVLNRDKLEIQFIHKGENVVKEVRSLICDIKAEENSLLLKLKCGNLNLRADRLTDNLLKIYNASSGYDVTKKQMFTADNTDLDCFLQS